MATIKKLVENGKQNNRCTGTCLTCTGTCWPKMTRIKSVPVQVQSVPVHDTRNAQIMCFSPIFPYVSTPINSIPHKYFKTTSNSSYDLFSTQFIIQSFSYFKDLSWISSKTILIWVLTHTQAKPKDLLGFILNPNSIACHLTMNPTSKGGFPTFLVDLEFLPTLISIYLWLG